MRQNNYIYNEFSLITWLEANMKKRSFIAYFDNEKAPRADTAGVRKVLSIRRVLASVPVRIHLGKMDLCRAVTHHSLLLCCSVADPELNCEAATVGDPIGINNVSKYR